MSEIILTEEQESAVRDVEIWRAKREGGFLSLTGPAGSGKTVLTAELVRRVHFGSLAAMTGKAALRLAECVPGRDTSTLHRVLYHVPEPGQPVRFEKLRPPGSTSIIIDESSMMSPQIHHDLKIWAAQGVKILLIGDPFQLPPVISEKKDREKWGEDYSVFSIVKGPVLTKVMRSVGGVLRTATKVREQQRICRESDFDAQSGEGYEFVECQSPVDRAIEDWLDDRSDHMLVTWRNSLRMECSRRIRDELGHGGPLPDPGEPVLIKKNGQGYLNGEIVPCGDFRVGPVIGKSKKYPGLQTMWMSVEGREGEVLVTVQGGGEDYEDEKWFDGSLPWVEDWKSFHIDLENRELPNPTPVTFGYVNTCHSAQGHQARRVTVFLEGWDVRSDNFNKPTTLPSGEIISHAARWVYTGQTRAKRRATLVIGT